MHKVKSFSAALGKLIQATRSQNMDQNELAQAVNLGRATISNIENGKGCNSESLFVVLEHLGLLDDFQTLVNDKLKTIEKPLKRKSRADRFTDFEDFF